MPPKQPTFKCGVPGCKAAPFSQVSLLHLHTAQAHLPPPKQPTFKCGAQGCEAAPFSQVSLLHEHTAQAHKKSNNNTPSSSTLPKQPTFKCGAQGCEAAPFSQVSLLHEHTAQAHQKSSNNTPSGSPLPKQPTFKCGALGCEAAPFSQVSLLHLHTAQAHLLLPKQPTFKCGVQGCDAAPFSQVSLLHEHTAQAHQKSSNNTPSGSPLPKQPTFKCGALGCKAAPFSQVSLLHLHTAQAHLLLPKQPTFKCGVQGCDAAPFSQVSLLHEHTAQAHQKSNNNTPSSSPLPKQPTFKCGAQDCEAVPFSQLSLLHEHTAQAHPPKSNKNTPSSSPGHASLASAIHEEVMQRLMQLELRQMLIDKSMLKVGMNCRKHYSVIFKRLENPERVKWMSKHSDVCSLAYSAKFRTDVMMLLQDFGYNDSTKVRQAFRDDDQVISHLFREVIHSGKEEILHLIGEEATGFMDALHKCIMASDDAPFVLPARRLLKNLCAATKDFPPTLFLELDSVDPNRQIGRGGFADIFLGRYKGQDIALKRLQVYQPEPNEMKFSLGSISDIFMFLPFFGLDEKSFEGYPPCIITPYMRNGTMNSFVKSRGGTLPDRRVERLGNVLIDDEEHAQLADFGLAIVADTTLGTTSTTQAGSFRWMAPELYDPQLESKNVQKPAMFMPLHLILPQQIYTGEQPFPSIQPDVAVLFQTLEKKRPPRPSNSGPPDGTRAMSDRLWATVEACWAHKPSDRPDMDKVSGLIMSP
ncbi:kinase-like domain-containing protein [Mycena olivaceomarginata]|nr:kinase-like domain-containing protein [Mycena olivaceomarginata]